MINVEISKERMEELLPPNIIETDVISKNAKKVLAYLLNQYLVNPKAKESGYVVASNSELSKACKISGGAVMAAIQELVEHKLVSRIAGLKRISGQEPKASEYTIHFKNLLKPLVKNNFQTLFANELEDEEMEFVLTNTNANTDSESDTKSDSEANTYTNTKTDAYTETKTETSEDDIYSNLPF